MRRHPERERGYVDVMPVDKKEGLRGSPQEWSPV